MTRQDPELDWELTAAQKRELERRVRDSQDRTRYILVSALSPTLVLYYVVADDVYAWKDPHAATLFKRRAAAAAIKGLLGERIQIVRCRVDRRGRLVASSLRIPRARWMKRTRSKR